MTEIFDSFKKKKEYLVCIDSDGCAMDTMDIKHFRCFGPCMIQEWGLGPWRDAIQNRWNAINLYTCLLYTSPTVGHQGFLSYPKIRHSLMEKNSGRIRFPVTRSISSVIRKGSIV